MNEEMVPGQESKQFEQIAHENFSRWNDALKTGDAKVVAELYFPDNTFLPTLSPDFKTGIDGAEDYFHHFLEKNPVGEIVEEAIQTLADDCYLHSGRYNFKVGPANDRSVVEARFTYCWKKDDKNQWKIMHHHSSIMPR